MTPTPDLSAPLLAWPLLAWYRANRRDLPWRRDGFGAWGILVSEVMLQQTPVVRVVPRLLEWLERWPTPADLAAAAPGDAVRAWQRLGYPRRALALHATAVRIVEQHGGVVPEDVDALLQLPGIGHYTARAVASFAFGRRHPVVDTNVRRVIARAVLGVGEAGPPAVRRDLAAMEALLPPDDGDAQAFNAAMMELGAVVCVARTPACRADESACPLADRCRWRAAGYPDYTGARAAAQKRFTGSDRHVRGIVLAELRERREPVPAARLAGLWTDSVQRERAVAGLIRDGLVVIDDRGYRLP